MVGRLLKLESVTAPGDVLSSVAKFSLMTLPRFSHAQIRLIAESFEQELNGRTLSDVLSACHIPNLPESSKVRRMVASLSAKQNSDGCGNNVAVFIEAVIDPVRFTGNHERFDVVRYALNKGLGFDGLQVGEDGKLRGVAPATSLTETQARASRLQSELERRRVHADVLRFCRAELLQYNYFHAVFEATKSVADKIRDKSGLSMDGSELLVAAFRIKDPVLAINTLSTETEQSEQKGFSSLLQGIFGTFRNVTAHAPKIKWIIDEQDALDLMTMCSYAHRRYAHRRLDNAVKVS